MRLMEPAAASFKIFLFIIASGIFDWKTSIMGFGTIFAFSGRFRPARLRSDDYWSQVSR